MTENTPTNTFKILVTITGHMTIHRDQLEANYEGATTAVEAAAIDQAGYNSGVFDGAEVLTWLDDDSVDVHFEGV